jgi:hypothetical protein
MAVRSQQNHPLFTAEVTGIDLRAASNPTTTP